MKRSEINKLITEAKDFFVGHHFMLPPFAFWSPADWLAKGHEYDEIRANGLGWDLTDFGGGDFFRTGLLLFTIRNGNLNNKRSVKSYAEKIMIVRENQVVPMHFHWHKMEDIINRGGGVLAMQLYQAARDDDKAFAAEPFEVSVDGACRVFEPGAVLHLHPGESVSLPPRVYHRFWGEGGMLLVGEISMVNDDAGDNCFHQPAGRFPVIVEDEPPIHCLCNEYPPAD